ncbi:MAG: hypothetical protein AB7P03_12645 [Kofleriaceae bacterium]
MRLFVGTLLVVGATACGGSGNGASDEGDGDDDEGDPVLNNDPRCVAACTDRSDMSIAGAGAVCDAASKMLCLDECAARIAGTSTPCGSCLVEEACLASDGCYGLPDVSTSCNFDNVCTVNGPKGSCSYPDGDIPKRDACHKQVNPRHEVECIAEFQPTTQCATLCD